MTVISGLISETGRIDVHSHLLPNVDDGCQSLEESLACARLMVQAGYTHSFCTPHIWPSLPGNTAELIPDRVARLQRELHDANISLRLFPGGELNMTDQTPHLARQDVVTYAMAGQYAIIDLWAQTLPPYFDASIRHLQSMGLKVILAHPERMRAVQDNPGLAGQFSEMGILLQGNLQCLGDPPDSATRRLAEKYLAEDRYFLLGSDLHNLASLPIRLKGLRRAIEAVGEEKVWQLTSENPRKLLAEAD
ncbi:MAG TPA: CpsB/CapC family capsule biosynthesis tyrosine phosphatase [Tepidisphaeraceae bacterium]|nr:CpsB/CapC family capsule biosynthesis tyrosine phosphatase [Tepidisphaeraceae bacterium]